MNNPKSEPEPIPKDICEYCPYIDDYRELVVNFIPQSFIGSETVYVINDFDCPDFSKCTISHGDYYKCPIFNNARF